MRWGITDNMSAEDVCLEEIRRCNEISYGPSFVVSPIEIITKIKMIFLLILGFA